MMNFDPKSWHHVRTRASYSRERLDSILAYCHHREHDRMNKKWAFWRQMRWLYEIAVEWQEKAQNTSHDKI